MKGNGKLVIDSNAYIAYRAGNNNILKIIDEAKLLFLPAPVLGELLFGAKNSNNAKQNEQILNEFLTQSVFIPIDESISRKYASIRIQLKKSGQPIPENDIWIAAASLELNISVLTNDDHFNSISGLKVINWDNG